jgi:hypothetical protein
VSSCTLGNATYGSQSKAGGRLSRKDRAHKLRSRIGHGANYNRAITARWRLDTLEVQLAQSLIEERGPAETNNARPGWGRGARSRINRYGDVAGDDGLTNDLNGANSAVTKVGDVALQRESIPGIRPQHESKNRECGRQGKDDAGMRPMGESGVRL